MGSIATETGNSTMPVKSREMQNHHMDSTVWNDFEFRPDDIVIATWGKSGTTWIQQVVSQLLNKGDASVAIAQTSPWVDIRIIPKDVMRGMLAAQTHRRYMKTHLPLDALVYSPQAKYIFVARDGRDTIWSMHHHMYTATDAFYQMINGAPGLVGPELKRPSADPRDLFVDLVDNDMKDSLWPFWSSTKGWWDAREQPNLLLVHFNDLKADLDGEMKRIAKFLGTPEMSEGEWKDAVEHCTFKYMKEHAETVAPPGAEIAWEDGAKNFVNKGTNQRWKDALSEEDNEKYLKKAREELGEEAASWLEKGRVASGVKLHD